MGSVEIMKNIEATKFYVRHREEYPETEMQDCARRGMWTLNVETKPYYWINDIDLMTDLSRTVGVAGFIGDVHHALRKMGKPIPENVDYPDELTEFLGRNIIIGTLDELRMHPGKPMFIKPLEHKAFSGFVWDGGKVSRSRIVTHGDETKVFMCEPLTFVSEFRSFILYDQVIDCRLYKGDWSKAPDRVVVESAVKKMKKSSPMAYCLDWGVTDTGKTLLVEMNEGYAFGGYGLSHVSYAQMLSARWHEMTQ